MKTAIASLALGRPGVIGIHRQSPDGWSKPTCSTIGRGPWVAGSWRRSASVPTLALAFRAHLDGLDPLRLWRRLHDLADGHEPILVTDAQPLAPNAMVRAMTAAWFGRTLSEEVTEIDGSVLSVVGITGIDPWAM